MAYQRPGMSDFTGTFGANQGISATLDARLEQHDAADPAAQQSGSAGRAGRGLPDRRRRLNTFSVNAYDPDIQMPYTQSYSVGWQRKLTRDSAHRSSLRRQPTRERLGQHQPQRAEHHHQRLRQRVPHRPGQPAGQHRGRPRQHVRLYRRGGHDAAADLPRATSTARTPPTRATPPPTPARTGPTRRSSATSPRATRIRSASCATPSRRATADDRLHDGVADQRVARQHDVPQQRGGGGPAGELLRRQSRHAERRRSSPTNSGGTRAHSMQFEYRKRFSNGFAVNTSYTFSDAELLARYGFNKPLEWIDQAGQVGNVRHSRERQLDLRAAVRTRPPLWQRGIGVGRSASSAAGRSTASCASRPASSSTSATCGWSAWIAGRTAEGDQSAARARAASCSSCRTTSCRTPSRRSR